MQLDLIGAIALTAASAIVIATLVSALPWSGAARARAAAALSLWFVAVVVLGASGTLDAATGFGPAGVGIAAALPLATLLVAVNHRRLLAPAVDALPLHLLVGVNVVRLLGLFFVVLYATGRLPAPFAPLAGWGDIIVGLTALPVAYLVATRSRAWRSAALLWNAFGFLDLVVAVFLGVTSSPGASFRIFFGEPDTAIMSRLPWVLVPVFLVPLLMTTHVVVFRRLLAPGTTLRPAAA